MSAGCEACWCWFCSQLVLDPCAMKCVSGFTSLYTCWDVWFCIVLPRKNGVLRYSDHLMSSTVSFARDWRWASSLDFPQSAKPHEKALLSKKLVLLCNSILLLLPLLPLPLLLKLLASQFWTPLTSQEPTEGLWSDGRLTEGFTHIGVWNIEVDTDGRIVGGVILELNSWEIISEEEEFGLKQRVVFGFIERSIIGL